MYQKSAFYDGNSKKQSGLKFCKFKVNSKFEWQNQKCFEHFLTHKLICTYYRNFILEMEKEDLLRSLRQIYKIVHGSSELMPTISTGK